MTHQKRHVRASKKGKRFIAGRSLKLSDSAKKWLINIGKEIVEGSNRTGYFDYDDVTDKLYYELDRKGIISIDKNPFPRPGIPENGGYLSKKGIIIAKRLYGKYIKGQLSFIYKDISLGYRGREGR